MPAALLCVYMIVSGITFTVYALDKRAAARGGKRTPEATLHLLELAGGWPGAIAAQRVLRHKNRKLSYQVKFWGIVVLHAAAWVWWIVRGQ